MCHFKSRVYLLWRTSASWFWCPGVGMMGSLSIELSCWSLGLDTVSDLRLRGNLAKLEEEDVPLTVGMQNAELTGHRGFGQNSQGKEESSKANSATGATLLCVWVGLLHTRWNNLFGHNSFTFSWGGERGKTWRWLFSKDIFSDLQAAICIGVFCS